VYTSKIPAIAVWDLLDSSLTECNDVFKQLFKVDDQKPFYLGYMIEGHNLRVKEPCDRFREVLTKMLNYHEQRIFVLKEGNETLKLLANLDVCGTVGVTTLFRLHENYTATDYQALITDEVCLLPFSWGDVKQSMPSSCKTFPLQTDSY